MERGLRDPPEDPTAVVILIHSQQLRDLGGEGSGGIMIRIIKGDGWIIHPSIILPAIHQQSIPQSDCGMDC